MNCLTRISLSLLALSVYTMPMFAEKIPNKEAPNWNQALNQLVTEHRDNLGLVGLGAMVMRDGEVIASAVAGERKHRSGILLTDRDKWHIGSITKSFTATMIARLVERGELDWDTTIGDIWGVSEGISESWQHVTLEHLLTHTSGAARDVTFPWFFKEPDEGPARMAARESIVLSFLNDEPKFPAGGRFFYSNAGIVIAGVMAEKTTGLPWEELIRKEIFAPLGIQSGGFGAPKGHSGMLEQPRGHYNIFRFIVSADTEDDTSPVIGPAGTIHIALDELLIYANDHLQGKSGQGKLLEAETYQHLHKPILGDYAYGWVVKSHEDWANGPIMWHSGSNGLWYALLVILP
ncbi:MAG TPA: serine hydrolase domain-containing protein, partial [Cellvibrionaceae bacterium]